VNIEDNNKNQEISSSEQFSFISLYLFILVFFIVLSKVVSSTDPINSVDKFLTEVKKIRTPFDFATKQTSNHENIFFNKQNLLQEQNQLKTIRDVRLSKKLDWSKTLDESGEFKEEFDILISEAVKFMGKEDGYEKELIFLISHENDDRVYEKISKLVRHLGSLNISKFLIQLDSKNPENSLYVQVVTK
jgi:hypothetical protein